MLPSLYEFYYDGGIVSGLSEKLDSFTLNNKTITIVSGSMHYFRVPSDYWRDRLSKIRAAGLNTIETYVPWMLHEPHDGIFDFGNGNSDFREFLDIGEFLRIVQEEDLLAIVRVGPYICSEMDMGGMPSWLLRNRNIWVRSSNAIFLNYFGRFIAALMSVLVTLQFTRGGPIIGFQVENEYIQFAQDNVDYNYLDKLVYILWDNGVKEMIFLAEDPLRGNLAVNKPKVLYVGNFGTNVKEKIKHLKSYLNGRPSMVMEYWTGWYDIWMRNWRTASDPAQMEKDIRDVFKSSSSLNFYMFVGGTTYGFLNGATGDPHYDYISPVSNSYDFGAPINEAGDYTWKYFLIKDVIEKYNDKNIRTPETPGLKQRMVYKPIPIIEEIRLFELLGRQLSFNYKHLIPMEDLPINNNSGQSYGYIVYRKKNLYIPEKSTIKMRGYVQDLAIVLINGELITKEFISRVDIFSFGYWEAYDSTLTIPKTYSSATLDIVVANLGRASYGDEETFRNQNKGLTKDSVTLNDNPLVDWEIIPLEFKRTWNNNLSDWKKPTFQTGPVLYKAVLILNETFDTFIDMSSWRMGIVIVNGFALSRYLKLGPTQTAFLPASLLKIGRNEIIVFEHFSPYRFICFLGEEKRTSMEPLDVPVYSPIISGSCHFVCYKLAFVIILYTFLIKVP